MLGHHSTPVHDDTFQSDPLKLLVLYRGNWNITLIIFSKIKNDGLVEIGRMLGRLLHDICSDIQHFGFCSGRYNSSPDFRPLPDC